MRWHPALLIAFLTGLIASGHISTNIYAPSMSAMVGYFDTDAGGVQMTLMSFLLAFAVGQLVYGTLSDRYGRRIVLLFGLVLFVAASVVSIFASTIEGLIAARVLQGFGAASGAVIGRAIIRDLFDRDQTAKVMAYVAMAMGLAPAFAPVLGGYIEEKIFDWRGSFMVIGVFAAIMLALSWRFLEETNKYAAENAVGSLIGGVVRSYASLLASREYLGYVITGSFVFGGIFAFMAGAPFVVIDILGRSPIEYGFLSVTGVAGYMAGSFLTSRITVRMGIDRMMVLGTTIMFAGAAILLAFPLVGVVNEWSIFVPLTVMAFGMAQLIPSTLAGAVSVYPRIAGAGAALYGFLQMSAAGTGILITATFADGTEMPMIFVVSSGAFAAAIALLIFRWDRRRTATAAETPV
jgi:DHA1 family bicyclomycin/chloramphenicol resistance-like MFS transporter